MEMLGLTASIQVTTKANECIAMVWAYMFLGQKIHTKVVLDFEYWKRKSEDYEENMERKS